MVSLPRPTIFLRHPSCSFEQSILHPPYYFFHPARKVSWRRIRSSSASGINFRPEKLVSRIKFHLEMNFIHRSFPVQINFILTEGKNYYAIRREIRCQPVVSSPPTLTNSLAFDFLNVISYEIAFKNTSDSLHRHASSFSNRRVNPSPIHAQLNVEQTTEINRGGIGVHLPSFLLFFLR